MHKTHYMNVVLRSHPICLTAKFPVNQIPNPDQPVRCSVEYDIAKAEVLVEGVGF